MYKLSEQQITFIYDDIRSRGITSESLQENLVDHICCMIENDMPSDSNFEDYYNEILKSFYQKELKEIQDKMYELINQKQLTMKRAVLITGIIASIDFIIGSVWKVMHFPGAAIFITTSLLLSITLFPMLLVLNYKLLPSKNDKQLLIAGVISGILFCMGALFKMQSWPGGAVIWILAITLTFTVFIPMSLFRGFNSVEKKLRQFMTVIVVLIAAGIQFALIDIRPPVDQARIKLQTYYQNDEIVKKFLSRNQSSISSDPSLARIFATADKVKSIILATSIMNGNDERPVLADSKIGYKFNEDAAGNKLLSELRSAVIEYNSKTDGRTKFNLTNSILDPSIVNFSSYNNYFVLSGIQELELFFATSI